LRRNSALTLETFEEETMYFLAGRAAEIVSIGDASAGAGGSEASDLARATSLVAAMIVSLGLGTDKSVLWRCPPEQAINLVQHDECLRSQVEERLEILQARAELLIREQLEAIERLAERLIERQRMTGEEVAHFLHQQPHHLTSKSDLGVTAGQTT
jgi:ATP-dependent Zn protease